jgi:hypothetical protein
MMTPKSEISELFKLEGGIKLEIPLFASTIKAGLPAPPRATSSGASI